MEAEGTVTKTNVYNCHNTLEERLLEQAEISFKAGKEEERKFILLWQKCPVCDGTGQVSGGYFGRPGDCLSWISSDAMEECRVCKGKGLIKTPSEVDNGS